MTQEFTIRYVRPADAQGALDVYAPYVLHTAASFEYEVPGIAAFSEKVEKISAQYPWLVCEHNNTIVGYAYASTHRDRTAYQWSPEATVYLDERYHRLGIARLLYNALFDILRLQGYFNIYAGVLMTNEKSVAFHKALGFEEIGIYKNIGYKLGEWHSNLWLQLFLQEPVADPPAPIPIGEVMETEACQQILEKANQLLQRSVPLPHEKNTSL